MLLYSNPDAYIETLVAEHWIPLTEVADINVADFMIVEDSAISDWYFELGYEKDILEQRYNRLVRVINRLRNQTAEAYTRRSELLYS